VSYLTQIGS